MFDLKLRCNDVCSVLDVTVVLVKEIAISSQEFIELLCCAWER